MRAKIECIEAEVGEFLDYVRREFFQGKEEEFEAGSGPWSVSGPEASSRRGPRRVGHGLPEFPRRQETSSITWRRSPIPRPSRRPEEKALGGPDPQGDQEALQNLVQVPISGSSDLLRQEIPGHGPEPPRPQSTRATWG